MAVHNAPAASAAASKDAPGGSNILSEEVIKSLEIERQRAILAEEEGAKVKAEAEQAWQDAQRKVEEAEARARAAEQNAKQALLEQISGSFGLSVPPATGDITAVSPKRMGRRSTKHQRMDSFATASQPPDLNSSVLDWVRALRLEDYQSAIAEAGTSLLDLKEMEVEDVAALGLKRLEEKRFLRALNELKVSQR